MCTLCKKYSHDELGAHFFFLKIALCAYFSWSPKNFVRTCFGLLRASCTPFLARIALHAHFSRQCVPTSFARCAHCTSAYRMPCPARRSIRPTCLDRSMWSMCIHSWHQGQLRRPRRAAAACTQAEAERCSQVHQRPPRRRRDHAPVRLNDYS